MQRIFAIGESLLDIVFKGDTVLFAQPGGSMLNTAVTLGRIGMKVEMVSEAGNDPVGAMIRDFLEKNGVSLAHCIQFEGKTKLALAFLDSENTASYSFYPGTYPDNSQDPITTFDAGDYLLFGSFYSVTPFNRQKVTSLVNRAREADSTILYDPNFRKPHLRELEAVKPSILDNTGKSDIIRGSDEDFMLIFGLDDPVRVYRILAQTGCDILIYTRGKNGVELITPGMHSQFTVPDIPVVSTIGAGDSFNAGILCSLAYHQISRRDLRNLNEATWERIIHTSITIAAHVCQQYDNYITADFAATVLSCLTAFPTQSQMTTNDNK
jgi:fructokinase